MNIFYDSEFTGLHQNTTLVSIGFISEDGRTFYAEFNDYDKTQVDDWLRENVLSNLLMNSHQKGENEYYTKRRFKKDVSVCRKSNVQMRANSDEIAHELRTWFSEFDAIEIWSDCLSYDWVLFNNLFKGGAERGINLPSNVFYTPFDICTLFKILNIDPDINREEFIKCSSSNKNKHNSLWDAKVIKACYEQLISLIDFKK